MSRPQTATAALGRFRRGGDEWNPKTVSNCESIMKQLSDRVKTFPIPDSHLNGAAVLACSIMDQAEATDELKELVPILRGLVAELTAVSRWTVEAVSDLLKRYDAAWQLGAAAREHPSFKVPDWFFEAESDDLRAMLTRRAKYLKAAKRDVDQAWDLLVEFLEANHHPVDQVMLSEIVTAVYRKWGR